MEKAKTDSDIDQFLQLPDYIVHDILSCLPFKEAVRTSVLSKRWQHMWIAESKDLQLTYDFFKILDDYSSGKSEGEIHSKREQQLSYRMKGTLRCRCMQQMATSSRSKKENKNKKKMAKSSEESWVHVRLKNSNVVTSLDRCISYATGCNVSNLILNTHYTVDYTDENEFYKLPRTVFAIKSLRDLYLFGWKLDFSLCTDIKLCFLTRLSISNVYMDDQIIQNLIANCPVIEKLNLISCCGSKASLNISDLVNPKLAVVDVTGCDFERVQIEALGLESFKFDRDGIRWREKCTCEIIVSTCKNMKKLFLKNANITDKLLGDQLSNLRLLEVLVLSRCDVVETIKISSDRLKLLQVLRCRNLVKVEIDDPYNLREFTYNGRNALSFSSKDMGLEKANICLYPDDDDDDNLDTPWFGKLIEFLGNLNNAKVLTLWSTRCKTFIVPKELRESLHPPLFNVKHINLYAEPRSLAIKEIVAGLLWFSLHPVTINIDSEFPEKHLKLKFLYKDNENPCCCTSLPIRRHCIKKVKIDSFDWGEKDIMSVKSCFKHMNLRWRWENADCMIGFV